MAETLIDLLAPDPGSGITPLRRATRSPEGDRTIATWTAAWRAFDEGLADDGHDHLAALIAQGFDGAPGAWPSPKEPWTDPTITALVPATLVFGMLGARADAFFGRLRLAPQLPSAARELTVANLRCGPCSIELHYNRNGSKHTFRVLQTGGPVPLNLVFEPTVPEAEIEAVEVDGHSADLDRFTVHRRSGARVHLPLDTERIITLIGPA